MKRIIICCAISLIMFFDDVITLQFFQSEGSNFILYAQVLGTNPGTAPATTTDLLEPQAGDVWIDLRVTKNVNPGDLIFVEMDVWQKREIPLENIQLTYLAPNAIKRFQGDRQYTQLVQNSIQFTGSNQPPASHLVSVDPGTNQLVQIDFTIPRLPVVKYIRTGNDSTKDPNTFLKIKFTLQSDRIISGSVRLIHWIDCYRTINNQRTEENTANAFTDIIQLPEFTIEKRVTNARQYYLPGDSLQYEISVKNRGGEIAENIYIVDIIPADLVFISAVPVQTNAPLHPQMNWLIPLLAAKPLNSEYSEFKIFVNVRVSESVVVLDSVKIVTNSAEIRHGEKNPITGSCNIQIPSKPDLVPRINSINKPEDWKLTDGIEIGMESSVLNIGGQPYTNDFKIRYWYVLLDNPTVTKQWEIDVRPGPTGISGGMKMTDPGFPIEIQKTKLLYGGVYRFCMKIIPTILPPDYSVEKDTTNNQICILDTIKVPLRFFLSKNVYEPTKTGSPLDLIFQIPGQTDVKINIYNVAGEFIKKQVDESFTTEGIYTRQWDGKNKDGNLVASGVYVCALESSAGHITRKVIVVR